jgi:hypothetical protein
LHSSSIGKALLGALDPAELGELLRQLPLPSVTRRPSRTGMRSSPTLPGRSGLLRDHGRKCGGRDGSCSDGALG